MNTPIYTGEPLSTWTHLTAASRELPNTTPGIWRWNANRTVIPRELDTISWLAAKGYRQVDTSNPVRLLCLTSQLCDVQYIGTVENAQPWARDEDIEHVDQCPVQLVFVVPSDDPPLRDATSVQMLHFVPPHHLGGMAMVADGDKSGLYSNSQLPEKERAVYHQLSDALKILADPGTWVTHTNLMSACITALSYERRLQDIYSAIIESRGKDRAALKEKLEAFKAARQHVVEVQQSFIKSDWQEQWEEIKRMARDLASAYWRMHHWQSAAARWTLPTIPSLFTRSYAPAPSALPMQAVVLATQDPDKWQNAPARAPYYTHVTKAGSTIIEFIRDENEILTDQTSASLWAQVKEFGDLDGDYLLIMLMSIIKGPLDENKSCWTHASGMIDARGIQPIMKADKPDSSIRGHHIFSGESYVKR